MLLKKGTLTVAGQEVEVKKVTVKPDNGMMMRGGMGRGGMRGGRGGGGSGNGGYPGGSGDITLVPYPGNNPRNMGTGGFGARTWSFRTDFEWAKSMKADESMLPYLGQRLACSQELLSACVQQVAAQEMSAWPSPSHCPAHRCGC